MENQVVIEKGIEIPSPYAYRVAMPEVERKARVAASVMRRTHEMKARGLCGMGGSCKNPIAKDHTLCDHHLEFLRTTSKERNRRRRESGLCRQCERPAFAGMVFCLVHRRSTGLPHVVKQGLQLFRELEQEEREAERREYIAGRLHLINNERTRLIITLRNGLDGKGKRTLEQIGKQLNITRERVRQIESLAMFKIEKDIPMPNTQRTNESKYGQTLRSMSVGDSFICTENEKKLVYLWSKRLGYIITSRRQADGNFRVWLVSKTEE